MNLSCHGNFKKRVKIYDLMAYKIYRWEWQTLKKTTFAIFSREKRQKTFWENDIIIRFGSLNNVSEEMISMLRVLEAGSHEILINNRFN